MQYAKTRYGYLLIGSLLVIVSVFVWLSLTSTSSSEVTITRTQHGFSPSSVVVEPGTKIIFHNLSNAATWPASDSHPNHSILPELDAGKTIPPHDSWSVVLHRPGTWKYHDHTAPQINGEIIVRGLTSTNECITASNQVPCWINKIEAEYTNNGLQEALNLHSKMIKEIPGYAGSCHDVLHNVGEKAYLDYSSDDSIISLTITSDCGFGFHHGLIEAMIQTEGSYLGTRDYCDRFSLIHGESNSCYHGVGHALFDSIGFADNPNPADMVLTASEECIEIFDQPKHQAYCIDGVGNGFVFAASNSANNINYNQDDPFSVCHAIDTNISFYCYEQIAFSRTSDFREFTEYVTQLNPELQSKLFYSHMKAHVAWRVPDNPHEQFMAMQKCLTLDSSENVTSCMGGVHHGVAVKEKAIFDTFKVNPDRISVSNQICGMFSNDERAKQCRESVRYLEDDAEQFL